MNKQDFTELEKVQKWHSGQISQPKMVVFFITCALEDTRVAVAVSLSKGLHHSVNLLRFAWQPETPQELSVENRTRFRSSLKDQVLQSKQVSVLSHKVLPTQPETNMGFSITEHYCSLNNDCIQSLFSHNETVAYYCFSSKLRRGWSLPEGLHKVKVGELMEVNKSLKHFDVEVISAKRSHLYLQIIMTTKQEKYEVFYMWCTFLPGNPLLRSCWGLLPCTRTVQCPLLCVWAARFPPETKSPAERVGE